MEFLQSLTLLMLLAISVEALRASIPGKDSISARDIRQECCRQKWWHCCKIYQRNISEADAATIPPTPRSVKNPNCGLAKSRREQSQALQCVTMLDILTAIHIEYRTVRELETCVPTVNVTQRSQLLRKISLLRNHLEVNAVKCCASHYANNHTARANEIVKKFGHLTKVRQEMNTINRYCPRHGHTETIRRVFSVALHRLGQQMKGLECLEGLSAYRTNFCLDKCIRKKSVEKCIYQWL